jgi:hypothetical protein
MWTTIIAWEKPGFSAWTTGLLIDGDLIDMAPIGQVHAAAHGAATQRIGYNRLQGEDICSVT